MHLRRATALSGLGFGGPAHIESLEYFACIGTVIQLTPASEKARSLI
jgi:hypothetical protein